MTGRVLVTGISGHVGRHLGRFLRAEGCRVVGLDRRPPQGDICDDFIQCNLLEAEALKHALHRLGLFDCLVHLAAIVAPTDLPDHAVLEVNVVGTYNILAAAGLKPDGRLVYVSSESVLGFAFSKRPLKPAFVPVDETHPTWAHDAYGLSKLLGEKICRAYHYETEITTVCLRPPWVWIPEEIQRCKSLVENPGEWAHSLWAYVVVDDLNSAVQDAMTAPLEKRFFAFFVAAAENGTRIPSRLLLQTYYHFTGPYADDFGEYESVISSASARATLGWQPKWGWKDWFGTLKAHNTAADTPFQIAANNLRDPEREARFRQALKRVNEKHGKTLKRLAE